MLKKTLTISFISLSVLICLGVSSVFGATAAERRALMQRTLKLSRQNATGIIEEEVQPVTRVITPVPISDIVEENFTAPIAMTGYEPEERPVGITGAVSVNTVINEIAERRPAAGGDELMDLVPEAALFCVRINNIDNSLVAMDQYLLGASPLQITGTVKMQLGQMFDDPMLSLLDTNGDAALFGVKSGNSDRPELIVGLIVPTAGNQFSMKFPNSDIGSNNYSLFILTSQIEHAYALVKNMIANASLVSRLDEQEYEKAVTAPLWAYGNMMQVAKDFRAELNSTLKVPGMGNNDGIDTEGMSRQEKKELRRKQIEERNEARRLGREEVAEQPTMSDEEMMQQQAMEMLEMYFDFIKTFVNDADYASIVIDPSPERLDLKVRFAAQDRKKLARWLDIESKTPTLRYLSMLDEKGAFNLVTKFNKNSLNDLMEFSNSIMTATMDSKVARTYKSIMNKSIASMGDEMAISFYLGKGQPPFGVTSVMNVNDPQAYRDSQAQIYDIMNDALGTAGNTLATNIPLNYSYEQGYSEYDGVGIDRMVLSFDIQGNAQEKEILNSLFGDGFDYRLAYTDDMVITVLSPYPDEDINYALERRFSSDLSGEMVTVLDYLPNAESSTFAGSLNIPKFLQGAAGMIGSLPIPGSESQIISGLLDGLGNGDTRSCISFAGNIRNGAFDVQVVLPKEHLAELVAIGTQLQARVQRMQEEQMQRARGGAKIQQTKQIKTVQTQDLPPELRQQIINDLEQQMQGKSPEEQMRIRDQIEKLRTEPVAGTINREY